MPPIKGPYNPFLMKARLTLPLLLSFLLALAAARAEDRPSHWTPLAPGLYLYNSGGDNLYLLERDGAAVIFGASDASILDELDEIGVKNVEWCFAWNTRREQVAALPEFKRRGIRIGLPDTSFKVADPPVNHPVEKSREFWESNAWRLISGNVSVQPEDIPLFSMKADFIFKPRPGEPWLRIDWHGLMIDVFRVFTPHRRAVAFIFDAGDARYAVTGRLLLPGGRVRRLCDVWRREYDDLESARKDIESSVRLLLDKGKVKCFLPEVGPPMQVNEIEDSLSLLGKRLSALASLSPRAERVRDAIVPGVRKYFFEGASYLVWGGEGHYLLVNAGFPPALDMLPSEVGDGKLDYVFVTDCRDIHAASVPSLSERMNAPVLAAPSVETILARPRAWNFPKNTIRPVSSVAAVREGQVLHWRGADLEFHELPELGAGHQMMLMVTPGARLLFLGDALIELRRFPFANPYYSCDFRPPALERITSLIASLKPTHIADDQGIRELKEPFDPAPPLAWAAEWRKRVADLLWPPPDMSRADPFWIKPLPDFLTARWGEPVSASVRVRNYSDSPLALTLSLSCDQLSDASWKKSLELGPWEEAVVPVSFTVRKDCPFSGVGVGIAALVRGRPSVPTQFIVHKAK